MQIACRHYKTIFSNGQFVIAIYLQLHEEGDKFVTCKGYDLPQNKNTFYLFTGEETVDKKGKKIFQVQSFVMAEPKTKNTISMFFNGDEFLGIGKTVLNNIVDTFGDSTFKVIENEPGRLLDIEGMDEEKLHILLTGYEEASRLKKLTRLLSPMGISQRQIKIISKSNVSLGRIKSDPFSLADIKGIGFKTCDTIARYENAALDSPARIKGGILEALQESAMMGDNYADDLDLIDRSYFKLNDGLKEAPVTRKMVINSIMDLINEDRIVSEKHNLYSSLYFDAESKTARQFVEFLRCRVSDADELVAAAEMYAGNLSAGQLAAVKKSLSSRASIITGGAGTGKTTILKAILKAYQTVYPDEEITLLAPTGKAAQRMSQITGFQASTIHSKLCIYDESDQPGNYISGGLVVVDEFSMVDMLLLNRLMMSLSFSCRLIMIGDVNQLPSVKAGNCLKDMIESGIFPVSHLKEVFRQNGGSIIENCQKILTGKQDLCFDKQTMLVKVKDEQGAVDQLKRIYRYYADTEGEDHLALITPLRSDQNGRFVAVADKLNELISESVNGQREYYQSGTVKFHLHDRVMSWKNTQDISNGDVGVITELTNNDERWGFSMRVKWENGFEDEYHRNDLDFLTHAYAMSVHKSQGSEYDTVVIPILKEHKCRLFRRSLLYTAASRAKKRLIIVTDDENQETIRYMARHTDVSDRNSGFKQKLQKYR